jgi:DUF4097 and DUF4098 domain-containing protein YvlB
MHNIRYTAIWLAIAMSVWGGVDASAQSVLRVDGGYAVTVESRIPVGPTFNKLIVGAFVGDVEIDRNSEAAVVIVERIEVQAENETEAREIAKENLSLVVDRIREIQIRGNTTSAQGQTIHISLPAHVGLSISTSRGDISLHGGTAPAKLVAGFGGITVEGVSEAIQIMTGAGDVDVRAHSGDVTIQTGVGSIDLSKVSGDVYAVTGAGEIVLRDIIGETTASTGGGEINGRGLTGSVTLLTAGGDIDIRYVKGAMDLSTSGGSIGVDDAIGELRAITAGGDIEVRDLTGSLLAEALAGDIEATGVNGDVKIVSEVGDISLEISDASRNSIDRIDIHAENGEIELNLPPGTNADFTIDLGFEGTIDTGRLKGNLIWDKPRQSDRRTGNRHATGVLNGGGMIIELSSGSGNVSISDRDRR